MAVDENDVKKICTTVANNFVFSESDEISHLAFRKTASKTLEDDLLEALDKGKNAMESFVKSRINKSDISFHDPIPKMKLSTFASLSVSKVKIGGKEVILKADRDLFARLVIAAQTKNIDLREVFAYTLGPVLWSVASGDESLQDSQV